jgi:two-component system, sensor histidine kinase and response regulator
MRVRNATRNRGILSFLISLLCSLILLGTYPNPARAQAPTESFTAKPPKNILILYSYPDITFTTRKNLAAFLAVMESRDVGIEHMYVEYMDVVRFNGPDYRRRYAASLQEKYAGRHIDLILTQGDGAQAFILEEGQGLFPSAPLLAVLPTHVLTTANSTRRIVEAPYNLDFQANLEQALKLFPQTTRVVFVVGTHEDEKRWELDAKEAFRPWLGKLTFEYTSGLTEDELLRRTSSLPPQTIIMYLTLIQDKTGRTFIPRVVAEKLAKTANAPIFGFYDGVMDTGVIGGGALTSFEAQGTHAGQLALDILDGTLPLDRPLTVIPCASQPMFDWRALQRWDATSRPLPPDSIIINRPASFWELYKTYIIAAVAICLAQSLLIAALLVQRRRRKVAEESFRVLVEQAPEAILVYDVARNHFVDANRNAQLLFACSREELLKSGPQHFYGPEFPNGRTLPPDMQDHIAQTLAGHEVVFDRSLHNAHGKNIICEVRLVRLPSKDRGLIRASLIDITDRKHAEQERQSLLLREQAARAQAVAANQAKDQFLAILSHELRTPLTPILLKLLLLERDPQLPAEMRPSLEMIRRNVELEVRLIGDLLDVSQIMRGNLRLELGDADVHDCLRAAMEICAPQIATREHHVTLDLQAQRHHMRADAVRLKQVFWNLLGNAIKYTPQGGTIILRSSNTASGDLQVQVIDNGTGIIPEVLDRIFEPFVQGEQTLSRRYGGLGLGLSIAKALVEAHHGTLTAASPGKDRGATFTMVFPAVATDAIPPPRDPSIIKAPPRPLRILLVEDDPDTLRVMKQLLRLSNHEIRTAQSVDEAVKCADAWEFDLLLSDIGLADGTGWDLLTKLRARRPVKAIAVSGFASEEDVQRSKAAGFTEHLTKPIKPEALDTVIQAAMQA